MEVDYVTPSFFRELEKQYQAEQGGGAGVPPGQERLDQLATGAGFWGRSGGLEARLGGAAFGRQSAVCGAGGTGGVSGHLAARVTRENPDGVTRWVGMALRPKPIRASKPQV